MFGPAKAITAAALIFGIGSAVLIAQPFGQQEGRVPEAATDGQPIDPVAFTARVTFGAQSIGVTTFEDVDGRTEKRGYVGVPIITASDPRFEGRLTLSDDNDQYPGPDGSFVLGTRTWRLETDDGAWQGSHPYFVDPGTMDEGGATVVLVGEGAYAGLYAALALPGLENLYVADIQGVIFPAGPPPVPGAP